MANMQKRKPHTTRPFLIDAPPERGGSIRILRLVMKERLRQVEKWGEQQPTIDRGVVILGEEFGEVAKAVYDLGAYIETLTDTPTNEQVEKTAALLSEYATELVQVAAVAVMLLEALDKSLEAIAQRNAVAPTPQEQQEVVDNAE